MRPTLQVGSPSSLSGDVATEEAVVVEEGLDVVPRVSPFQSQTNNQGNSDGTSQSSCPNVLLNVQTVFKMSNVVKINKHVVNKKVPK